MTRQRRRTPTPGLLSSALAVPTALLLAAGPAVAPCHEDGDPLNCPEHLPSILDEFQIDHLFVGPIVLVDDAVIDVNGTFTAAPGKDGVLWFSFYKIDGFTPDGTKNITINVSADPGINWTDPTVQLLAFDTTAEDSLSWPFEFVVSPAAPDGTVALTYNVTVDGNGTTRSVSFVVASPPASPPPPPPPVGPPVAPPPAPPVVVDDGGDGADAEEDNTPAFGSVPTVIAVAVVLSIVAGSVRRRRS